MLAVAQRRKSGVAATVGPGPGGKTDDPLLLDEPPKRIELLFSLEDTSVPAFGCSAWMDLQTARSDPGGCRLARPSSETAPGRLQARGRRSLSNCFDPDVYAFVKSQLRLVASVLPKANVDDDCRFHAFADA